jgi:epoxide hydrolase-like predicted phosphatase
MSNPNKITTIIFDLSEVYLTGLKESQDHFAKLWNVAPEEVYSQFKSADLEAFWHGKITEDEFWKKIIAENNWKFSLTEIKKLVRDNFKEIEGTRAIIERLKKVGFKLSLLSVHSREWVKHCEDKFDYHKLFDSVVYSFEIEVCKPDKKSYQHIIEKLKVKPEECLFIDDSKRNIDSAREMGIRVIHFKNSDQLKEALEVLGIKL